MPNCRKQKLHNRKLRKNEETLQYTSNIKTTHINNMIRKTEHRQTNYEITEFER